MGQSNSASYERNREKPDPSVAATLYYFEGRGVADQIRWLLAVTDVTFKQKNVTTRSQFLKMSERQLPFGQLPLLQIDGLELVQSQVIVRYLAKRGNMAGLNSADEIKCDMIAETIRDMIGAITSAPFHKFRSVSDGKLYLNILKDKWIFMGKRFEAILVSNGGKYLVGDEMTYVDVLLAHALTWYVEECGPEIVDGMPYIVGLQNRILEMESIQNFIKGPQYYPIGDAAFCQQVTVVLGRS